MSTHAAKPDRSEMIRVDQAGEFGATRIYAGQLAVMGDRGPHSAEIRAMAEQEVGHREEFDRLMAERGVRPTVLQPFWHVAGFALGAGTALIGPEAATRFRDDEREHRDAALAAGAEKAPAYPLLSAAIRLGCRAAIRLSEKI